MQVGVDVLADPRWGGWWFNPFPPEKHSTLRRSSSSPDVHPSTIPIASAKTTNVVKENDGQTAGSRRSSEADCLLLSLSRLILWSGARPLSEEPGVEKGRMAKPWISLLML
jgi:hypothetical protein